MYRALAVVLFGLSLLIPSPAVFAQAVPYPSRIIDWCLYGGTNMDIEIGCGFDSPTPACRSVEGPSFIFNSVTQSPGHGYSSGVCLYSYYPGGPIAVSLKWRRKTLCYKGGWEEDNTAAAPVCSCLSFPPGYVYPPVFPNGDLSICVPGPVDTCPITDILPFGPPDPVPLNMTNISPLARSAADCLLLGLGIGNVGGAGDSLVFSSGFRTLEYQQHFYDLWMKRQELKRNNDANCAALKAKIENHFKDHKLGGDLSPTDPSKTPNNCHSSGTCFDMHTPYIPDTMSALACMVFRPHPIADKWHVVPF